MARVSLQNVSKTYAVGGQSIPALREVSLEIPSGGFLVLVGPSGSGKTTLLRIISGLEQPTHGIVRLDGEPVNDRPAADRDVGFVFQNDALYPHLTVGENLGFGLRVRRVPRDEITRRVAETAEMLGLAAELRRNPAELSGGERQRVALGRALIRRPRILLLDEPLAHLDPVRRRQLRREILKLHRSFGLTVVCVTHDQSEAGSFGSQVAVLHNGVLQQVGSPQEIYESPANQLVAGFLGSPPMNFFRGTIARENDSAFFVEEAGQGAFWLRLGSGAPCVNGRVLLGIRPECLVLGGEGELSAQVEAIIPQGQCTLVELRTAAHEFTAVAPRDISLRMGEIVRLRVPSEKCHWFDAATFVRIA